MIFERKTGWSILGVAVLLGGLISCSPIYVMKVHYQMPSMEKGPEGKKVFLVFKDERPDRTILTSNAENSVGTLADDFSFSWGYTEKPGVKMGIYGLDEMFKAAFRKRLNNLGVDVVKSKEDSPVELVIALKTFRVDLVGSSWKVTLDYDARLIKGGQVLAKQFVQGQGKRFKWVGRGELDKAVSEIFSDSVNRLNLERLYQLANI